MLTLVFACAPAGAADNTDVVIFNNGDRLTGELKSLERGKLRFKTDATGTIPIEWDDVAYLRSNQNVQVETADGVRYFGNLTASAARKTIVVAEDFGPVELDADTVVLMSPIEAKGLNRLDGDITAGYNFTKANSVQQVNFGLDVDVRSETRIFNFTANTTQSDSDDSESSQRHNISVSHTRLWPRRWFGTTVLGLDRNDELNLDLRTSLGYLAGRYVKQTNSALLALGAGAQVSRENIAGAVEDEQTVEGVLRVDWDWFRYDSPELDLGTSLRLYPNLSDTGRVRGEFDITLRWEIIDDLFWQLSFYESYDSDPVDTEANSNDYGITTSLGWSF